MRTQRGFTLVEVILAIFLFVIIVAGITAFMVYYLNNYSFSFEEQQSINQTQSSITTLVREIREARLSETGAWPLVQTDDNALVFYSDVTNDGRVDRVRYFLDGTTLKKGVIQPTNPPNIDYPTANEVIYTITSNVDNASSPLFTYYNGDWPGDTINNPLQPSSRILQTRLLNIHIRINISPTTGSQPFELTSSVTLKNLKDNL